jgi:hypothetical protein
MRPHIASATRKAASALEPLAALAALALSAFAAASVAMGAMVQAGRHVQESVLTGVVDRDSDGFWTCLLEPARSKLISCIRQHATRSAGTEFP